MGTAKRISRNALFLTLATGLGRLGRLAVVWYIGRHMGAAALGEYGIIMTFASMFQAFGVQGLNPLVMREVARARREVGSFLSNIAAISVLMALAFVLVMDAIAWGLHYPSSTMLGIVVMGISIVPGTVARTLEAAIKAGEKMEYVALWTLLQGIVVVALAMLALDRGWGLMGVFWSFVVGELLLACVYVMTVNRTIGRIRFRLDWAAWRELRGTVGTFFGTSMAGIGLRRLDVVVLSKLCDATAVGLYTAPFKLVDALMALRPAIGQAMFPSMARFSEDDRGNLRLITVRSVKFLTVLLLPVALCVTIVARDAFTLYYSPEFAVSGLILQVLVWSLVPFYIQGVLNNAIIVEGGEKMTLRIAVISLVLNIALSFLLVPHLGALGTALAMVFTTLVRALQSLLFANRSLFRFDIGRTFAKPCLATCLAGGVACLLIQVHWSLIAVLPVTLALYAILVIVLGVLSPDEIGLLKRIPRELGR